MSLVYTRVSPVTLIFSRAGAVCHSPWLFSPAQGLGLTECGCETCEALQQGRAMCYRWGCCRWPAHQLSHPLGLYRNCKTSSHFPPCLAIFLKNKESKVLMRAHYFRLLMKFIVCWDMSIPPEPLSELTKYCRSWGTFPPWQWSTLMKRSFRFWRGNYQDQTCLEDSWAPLQVPLVFTTFSL